MNRSTRLAAVAGALCAAAAVPATASAHTAKGSTQCVLVKDVPTITTTVEATAFAGSGGGGGGRNTVRYEVLVDATSTKGTLVFTGTSGKADVVAASTEGTHAVKVFAEWSSADTRDGHAQARTQVADAKVTCPAPPKTVTPPPTTPPPTTPPTTPPPTTPPTTPEPPAETPPTTPEPPVVTPPAPTPPPAATPPRTPVSAPSTSKPKKQKPKRNKPKAGKSKPKKNAPRKPKRAKSQSPARRPNGNRPAGFTG